MKRRIDTSWFCNSWIAQWLKFFLQIFFFFWFWPSSSGGKKRSKLDQKCKLWVSPVSVKIWVFQRFLKHCFCFLNTACGENISKIWKFWGGIRAQNLPKKGHFMDAESVQKTLKIYNLTIKNAMLIKLTTLCIFMRPFIC